MNATNSITGSPPKSLGVVIPTYNRCDALLECMQHLERQTSTDFEVVVVDDGSTDQTRQAMESYLVKSPLAIRYVRQSNSGPAKARNVGVSMLRAPVCVFLGDDIFASRSLLDCHAALHRESPAWNVAGLGWTQWSASGQTITPFMQWLGESPYQFAYRDLLAGQQPDWHHFYTSNLSVKTELLRKLRFNEKFPYAALEDSELGYRIHREYGLTLKFLPEAIAYHLHPTTFRQACERMVRVGYSTRLMDEAWPGQRPQRISTFNAKLRRVISRSTLLTRLLIELADLSVRAACPNRLMTAALSCKFEIGYESQRDPDGKLVPRRI